MPEEMRSSKYIVHGHVQGVGFRYFVYKNAKSLGLTGYARNLYDGTVEVLASGPSLQLDQLYNIMKQGPSRSRVDKVLKSESEYDDQYTGFGIA